MKRILIVAGALLLSVGAVVAQQDVVNKAQTAMKSNGRAVGALLSPMIKGDKPYDQAVVDEALKALDDTAKALPALFPESTKGLKPAGDFSASPKIWEDKAGFSASVDNFAKAVTQAKAKVKDLDSLKATMPSIGKECSSCHEAFRLKNG